MGAYNEDRAWSDRFIPALRALIGPHLLKPSTLEQDTKQAADLVLVASDVKIACRVRRHGFAEKYPRQFTLRSKRNSGATTEFRKVLDGWGDWMFYGHSEQDELNINPWWLIDLGAFRTQLANAAAGGHQLQRGETANPDGATHFQWFDIDSFQSSPQLLIAESAHPWPARGRVAPWPRPVQKENKYGDEILRDPKYQAELQEYLRRP